MNKWKHGVMTLFAIFVTTFFSGCNWSIYDEFNPYEHIGTRWVCQELDLYFDINEVMVNNINKDLSESSERGIWCSGELNVNKEKYYIRIDFNADGINMYLQQTLIQPNSEFVRPKEETMLMNAYISRCRNYELQIGTKDAEFFSPLQYDGEYLSFEQYDIPDGERPYTLPTVIDS